MAKTVIGNVYTLKTTAASNATVRFKYRSAGTPGVALGGLVSSVTDVVAKVGLTGTFSTVLIEGYYEVSIDDSSSDKWIILVDDVAETVDIIDIITALGTLPVPSGIIPIGSPTAYGKVKVDSTTEDPIAVTGVFTVATEAALRAKATASNNKLAFTMGGTAAFDGLQCIYGWDSIGTSADNSPAVIRPNDYSTAGIWRKLF